MSAPAPQPILSRSPSRVKSVSAPPPPRTMSRPVPPSRKVAAGSPTALRESGPPLPRIVWTLGAGGDVDEPGPTVNTGPLLISSVSAPSPPISVSALPMSSPSPGAPSFGAVATLELVRLTGSARVE